MDKSCIEESLDPSKDTATEALKGLHHLSVDVKIRTGDNQIVTACIGKEAGMPVDHLLRGSQFRLSARMIFPPQ